MNKYFNRLEYGRRLLAEPLKKSYTKEEIKAMLGFLITAMGQTPVTAKNMVAEKIKSTSKRQSEKKLSERVLGITREVVAEGYDDIAPIKIYKVEVDAILQMPTMLHQKIAFIYLCNLRYHQSLTGDTKDYYVNISRSRIYEGLGRTEGVEAVNKTIFDLRCRGLLCNKPGINETKGVLFEKASGDVAFEVDDLRNLGTIWNAHTNKTMMRHKVLKKCACCDAPFLDSSTKNNTLYCSACRRLPQYKRKT